jgi:orotidine-5'-phosphate decarboxylase
LKQVRAIVGDMPILIPGVGAQGGDIEATVTAGKDSRGQGMIINASRTIIYASSSSDFAQAARSATGQLRAEINRYR